MDLEDRKLCAEFAGWSATIYSPSTSQELWIWKGEFGQWAPHFESDPAAACSLLPKLMQEIVRRGGYSKGHYDARQFWLDLIEKSNSLTRPEEVCRLIVEAVRAEGEEKRWAP